MATPEKRANRGRGWSLAFLVSWIGILVIPLYNRSEPVLGGFPMFYWYQFALVVVSAVITWIVHLATLPAADDPAEGTL